MFEKKQAPPVTPPVRSTSPVWNTRPSSVELFSRKPLKVEVAPKKSTNHDIHNLGMPAVLISDRGLPLPKKGPSPQVLIKTQTDVIIKLQEENRLLDAIAERQELLLRARGTCGTDIVPLTKTGGVEKDMATIKIGEDPLQALRESKQLQAINQLRMACATLKGNIDAQSADDQEREGIQARKHRKAVKNQVRDILDEVKWLKNKTASLALNGPTRG